MRRRSSTTAVARARRSTRQHGKGRPSGPENGAAVYRQPEGRARRLLHGRAGTGRYHPPHPQDLHRLDGDGLSNAAGSQVPGSGHRSHPRRRAGELRLPAAEDPRGSYAPARDRQAVGAGLLRQALGGQVRGQRRPERRHGGGSPSGQGFWHQLCRQRGVVPAVPQGQRLQPGSGHDRRQRGPRPAAQPAGTPPGLLHPRRGRAARRHRGARSQGPHKRSPPLQRARGRTLPGHARGRQGLRGLLRHPGQRAGHHLHLGRAGDEGGGQLLRLSAERQRLHQRRPGHLRRRLHP